MLNMTIKSSAAIWKEASKAIKGYTYAVVGSPSPIVSHIYTLYIDSLASASDYHLNLFTISPSMFLHLHEIVEE